MQRAGKYRIIHSLLPHTLRDRYLPTPTTQSTEFREIPIDGQERRLLGLGPGAALRQRRHA